MAKKKIVRKKPSAITKRKTSTKHQRSVSSNKSSSDTSSSNKSLREHVLYLLRGGGAHIGFDQAMQDWPVQLAGARILNFPHTAWMLVEHMRIAQWDILEFSRKAKHISPAWPEGYWPDSDAPESEKAWKDSIAEFRKDLRAMEQLVASPKTDLHAELPWGEGQTVLREALLVADHNAYHLGQLVMLRKAMGI